MSIARWRNTAIRRDRASAGRPSQGRRRRKQHSRKDAPARAIPKTAKFLRSFGRFSERSSNHDTKFQKTQHVREN